MGKIKKILGNELVGGTSEIDIYPITSTKAVYDTDNKMLDVYIQHLKKTRTFIGTATPATNPGTPDGPVFYLASRAGAYSGFGLTIPNSGLHVLYNLNGSWKQEYLLNLDAINTHVTNLQSIVEGGEKALAVKHAFKRYTVNSLEEITELLDTLAYKTQYFNNDGSKATAYNENNGVIYVTLGEDGMPCILINCVEGNTSNGIAVSQSFTSQFTCKDGLIQQGIYTGVLNTITRRVIAKDNKVIEGIGSSLLWSKTEDLKYKGKKAVFFGGSFATESIALSDGTTEDAASVVYRHLKNELGFAVIDTLAHGGAGFSNLTNNGYHEAFDTATIPMQVDKLISSGKKYDLYVLWASTNDYSLVSGNKHLIPIGNVDSTDLKTQSAGISYCISKLKQYDPTSKIMFLSSLPISFNQKENYGWSNQLFDTLGEGLYNYVQGQKMMCEYYKIPFLDMFTQCGITKDVYESFFRFDYIHYSSKGYELIAPMIVEFVKTGLSSSRILETPFGVYRGIATTMGSPSSEIGVFYLANREGEYRYFVDEEGNPITLSAGEVAFFLSYIKNDGSIYFIKETLLSSTASGVPVNSYSFSTAKNVFNSLSANSSAFLVYYNIHGKGTLSADEYKWLFGNYNVVGLSSGDIIAIVKSSVVNALGTHAMLLRTQDAKPVDGSFPGADGLESVWDKTQINKIPSMETTLAAKVSFPSITNQDNMNNCLESGVYPWCVLGRPAGSTGAFTLIVTKSTTADNSGFYTVEQTAYGRTDELGKIFKRLIFTKNDETQFGDWLQIV